MQVSADWAWTALTQREKHSEMRMVRSSLKGPSPEELGL